MTSRVDASTGDASEVTYLLSPRAIRERAEALYALGLAGELEHWTVDETRLPAVADRVLRVTRAVYPDPRRIPFHGRFRHFDAGGVERVRELDARLSALEPDERLAARFDLVITSVLLDAGAGERWSYRDERGNRYTRSEGLAVASYDFFVSGGFSSAPERTPLRADADVLERLDTATLARAFQVSEENPLVGLDGRADVLRRLGRAVREGRTHFDDPAPRPGHLALFLATQVEEGRLPTSNILGAVLDALGPIWPGRETLEGVNLGDVWPHPAVGRVPFHKLSQWLSYSLCEPLEAHGVATTDLDELTGLAEYRNGGLFVDAGVLVPKHEGVLGALHAVSSTVVVEWRALTVALLDRTAELARARLGLSREELPLVKVLEGGTWRAGREIAAELRPGGVPPLGVRSDGTVF